MNELLKLEINDDVKVAYQNNKQALRKAAMEALVITEKSGRK